ncbi:arsenite efflux transporter metallochaperone ArsD [Mesobacillus selenatarsenatis]|uniref:Arsenical resistance operon trans-acting repressor ArsD n=1 Tax=Mesobacillus selenatarsenatis (strain DSM 18680 / JCM 14380 / FERM P-15431 / SF-1) TaxID=1321606 RepID=A0A0A8WXD1_MESS1|nr:arsenite efflux transporter metallochaperone ArsD [Mesobacillus selenatarsenatis]GAM12288.1 arsenical resistance operon trans-acting repressor ArsD [Mesobacillus selenatarsenatis SF-1]
MKKVEIFDPALCCPTGVCGPSVDPELTRMASAVFLLQKKGFDISRYNLANEPGKFAENEAVNKILHEKGPDALPVTLLDGEIIALGNYPTNEQLSEWSGINISELKEKKSVKKIDFK